VRKGDHSMGTSSRFSLRAIGDLFGEEVLGSFGRFGEIAPGRGSSKTVWIVALSVRRDLRRGGVRGRDLRAVGRLTLGMRGKGVGFTVAVGGGSKGIPDVNCHIPMGSGSYPCGSRVGGCVNSNRVSKARTYVISACSLVENGYPVGGLYRGVACAGFGASSHGTIKSFNPSKNFKLVFWEFGMLESPDAVKLFVFTANAAVVNGGGDSSPLRITVNWQETEASPT